MVSVYKFLVCLGLFSKMNYCSFSVAGKVKCKRCKTGHEEEERIPLEPQGGLETGSDTDKDGPSSPSMLRGLEVTKGPGQRVKKRKNVRKKFKN